MRRKYTLTAVVACAGLLTVSLASPATGVPSLRSIAKTAKAALALSRAANRTAKAGVTVYQAESGEVPAGPGDFAEFDVDCPAGYQPTGFSMGLGALQPVSVLATPTGYIGSYYNRPDTGRILSGTLDVQCVNGRRVYGASATRSKADAVRGLEAAERTVREVGD